MNMMEYLQSPEVVSALIHGVAIIIGSVIAAVSAVFISSRFRNRNTFEQNYLSALNDIEFLLAVERAHCDQRKGSLGVSPKNRVRAEVLKQGEVSWSGRFTRSRISEQRRFIAYNKSVRESAER